MQARTIAEKFVLQPPLPGDDYYTDPWSVMTNPVGHPSRQGVLLITDGYFKELMRGEPNPDVKQLLARKDLFKDQRDFLKEQATRRDSLPLEGGGGRCPAWLTPSLCVAVAARACLRRLQALCGVGKLRAAGRGALGPVA